MQFDNDPERSLQFFADIGIPVLGIGRSRIAIRGPEESVYKLAWRPLGLAENQLEVRVYQQAPDDLRQVLAPIISPLESGAIQQGYCQPVSLGSEAAEVLRTLSQYGIVDGVMNLGRYQQRIVCYDYALLGTARFFQVTDDQ